MLLKKVVSFAVAGAALADLTAELGWKPSYSFVNGKYEETPRPYDTFRDQCTSIVVGKAARSRAGKTGHVGPLSSHSNDCADCEIRMAAVSAKNHTENSMRGVNDDIPHLYPRRVEYGRASIYEPEPNQPLKPFLGYIPEAASTNALYESSYPLMNEHGLAFGESTTEAKSILANAQVGHKDPRTNNTQNGTALFTISQLMQVALERCETARCAISTMANVSEMYGFAGEAFGASEMVSIVDKKEAWIFEITGAGPYKGVGDLGSLWVAQRVPDDHVAVIANYMIIQKINPDDEENFMVSPHLFPRLKELGLFDGPVSEFNWQEVMGGTLQNLEMYDLLRRWRIYSRVAPSMNMQPTHKIAEMPFSVKPDQPLSELDVMNLFRDHYEGTEYDMTQGVLAGPNGNPNYELTGRDMQHVKGQIPRAMSLMRTAYTSIVVADEYPKVWFGVDAPASSVFVPFWADALASGGNMSERFMIGRQQVFDRQSAHWAFNFVANWMSFVNHRNMSLEYVYPKRDELQAMVIAEVEKIEHDLASNKNQTEVSVVLGETQTDLQEQVVSSWWNLADMLVMRYNDGYFNFPEWAPNSVKIIDIPVWFLQAMGFGDDFIRPTMHHFVPFFGKLQEALDWTSKNGFVTASSVLGTTDGKSSVNVSSLFFTLILVAAAFFVGSRRGAKMERAALKKISENGEYQRIIA
jgi:dipeptidase